MCISPIKVKIHEYRNEYRFVTVPCGRCYECVRRKKLDWEIRLWAAQQWCSCSFFRLLTYSEENYNFDITDKEVLNTHIQNFLKRLRSKLKYYSKKDIELKYFIASELGDEFDRLHYHCCIFLKGIEIGWPQMSKLISSCWPYGYIGNTYMLNSHYISYACKYIQKQSNFKWYSRFPIRTMLPEVERYIRLNSTVYDKDDLPVIPYRGKRVRPPKYFLRQILQPVELLHLSFNSKELYYDNLSDDDITRINMYSEKKFKQSLYENENNK